MKHLHPDSMLPPPPVTCLLFTFLLVSAQDAPPVQVIGLINQSVRLSGDFRLTGPVEDVIWMFHSNGKSMRIAGFIYSQFKLYNFTDQFIDRLNQSDDKTGLIIRDLRAEDSGLYEETITLKTGETHRVRFNLTVYDPVPVPEIQMELHINSSDWCNFTLHCSVPTNAAALSVSWKSRRADTEYAPINQTADNNGRTVRLYLTPRSRDAEFLCLVQNPADQKHVTVSAREICRGFIDGEEGKKGRNHIITAVLVVLILLLLISGILILWKKKRKESHHLPRGSECHVKLDEASPSVLEERGSSGAAEKDPSQNVQYMEISQGTFNNRAQESESSN